MKRKTSIFIGLVLIGALCFGISRMVKNQKADSGKSHENVEYVQDHSNGSYNIGGSAALKDWEIAVTDVQVVDSIENDYGSFSPNEDGNKYIQVFVTVTNNGKKADVFLPTVVYPGRVQSKIVYQGEYEFTSTNLLGYSNDLHDSTINPLSSRNGEITFEVSDTLSAATDELLLQFTLGNDAIAFKIR